MNKRLLAGSLCLLLTAMLAACTNTAPAPTPTVAMGRYMEETMVLPEGLSNITFFQMIGDRVWLAGNVSGGEFAYDNRSFHIWSSDNFGDAWRHHDYDFYDELEGLPNSVYMVSDDEMYISTRIEGGIVAGDNPGEGAALLAEYFLYRYTAQGGLEAFDATILQEAYSAGEYKEILITEAGDLVLNTTENYIHTEGVATRVKRTLPQAMARYGATALWGDTIAGYNAGQIDCHSLETGDLIATIPVDITTNTVLTAGPDGDSLFYMNADGIFHAFLDGAATERIVDGELYAINLPTLTPRHLVMNSEGSFLTVLTAQSHYALYRYTYDAEMPTVPSREIRVYSLHDNSHIRQAIGAFHRADPDVRAVFDIGVPAGGSITVNDALRTLSTELLAGSGPDVLVLDGMPTDSYIQQGVLHDLAPLFDASVADDTFIPAIANTYRDGDVLYALPARFTLPVMQGIEADAVVDITSLADWLETQSVKAIGMYREDMVERFYGALAPGWFLPDGSLDTRRFTDDLEQLGRIAGMLTDYPQDEKVHHDTRNMAPYGAVLLQGETAPIVFSEIGYFLEFAPANQVHQDGVADPMRPFPAEGVFVPKSILGVNAAGGNIALAETFVRTATSFEILAINTGDGFSVRRDALRASSENPMPADQAASAATVYNARLGAYRNTLVYFSWPGEDVVDDLIDTLGALTVPSPTNVLIKAMVLEETADFITGQKSLEDTVASLVSKLSIYLSQ